MDGFIPNSRGSLMLDLVAVAMLAVLPVLAFAIASAKWRKDYSGHKKIMLGLSSILLVAVILFELEMRLLGWKHLAEPSPYYLSLVPMALVIHLIFSVSTVLLLAATVTLALKRFTKPPRPGNHSPLHKTLGKVTAVGLFMTSVTGWIFYYLAFIAI